MESCKCPFCRSSKYTVYKGVQTICGGHAVKVKAYVRCDDCLARGPVATAEGTANPGDEAGIKRLTTDAKTMAKTAWEAASK